jgi:sarcosine oxidase subunit beta
MRSSDETPIVVVGAGIMGLSVAHHLLASTEREVVVVDAGDVGNGTTPAGAGFVAPWATVLPSLGGSGLAIEMSSLAFYRELHDSGAELGFRSNGNIVFFNTEETRAAGVGAIMGGAFVTHDTRSVGAAEIADLTSGAVDPSSIAGGVFMPGGIQLETVLVLNHLADTVEQRGGTIRRGSTLESVVVLDGRLVGVRLTSGDLATDTVVLATGAWLNETLAGAGWRLPLLPFMATRLVTEDVGLATTMPTLQGKDFPLWIRESQGGFTWGTTVGYAPAHRAGSNWASFNRDERQRMDLLEAQHADVERVARVFPALRDARTIRAVQGMPVYTVDGQFFVGAVPCCQGLWALGGDNESGVSHGPGMARLLVDLMTGATPLCDPAPYSLDRFAPGDYYDEESVAKKLAADGAGWLAEAVRQPSATR